MHMEVKQSAEVFLPTKVLFISINILCIIGKSRAGDPNI
jgi:hypothetical protein